MGSHIFGISGIRISKSVVVSRDLDIGRFAVKKWFVLLSQNLTVDSNQDALRPTCFPYFKIKKIVN